MKKGDFSNAEVELREAIQVKPDHANALRDLGWMLYGKTSKLDEALGFLERAQSLDRTIECLDLYLALVLARLNRKEEAEASFQRALITTSNTALAHAVYANFFAENGRTRDAERHFIASLSRDPNWKVAIRDYARFLASEGRNDEARIHFRRALENDPEDATTVRYWNKFLDGQRPSETTVS